MSQDMCPVSELQRTLFKYHPLIHALFTMELAGQWTFNTGRTWSYRREIADLRQELLAVHDEVCDFLPSKLEDTEP